MTGADLSSGAQRKASPKVEVSISIRTVLVVAVAVAGAWALASIGNVLLLLFVGVFNVAVLSPVVAAMERRLGWSRGRCATLLVLALVVLIAVLVLILTQAIGSAVSDFSRNLPQIVDKVKHSDVGSFLNPWRGGGRPS